MARWAVCLQSHQWDTEGVTVNDGALTCPTCGAAGRLVEADSSATILGGETLPPWQVPPLPPSATHLIHPHSTEAGHTTHAGALAVPGYEIERELGRGGMGVVYLARHLKLKRQVALKMIIAGEHSDAAVRVRFRREAQAIAQLQHPGIVQIHDVGEHHGLPYLALEYIEGGSLARRIAGHAVGAKSAAELIESLARTISHAHERGIVHRDLTPGNVLLSQSDSARGIRLGETDVERVEPKITDFGLAKQSDGDARQTRTGMIMGTPSYMSPEQAQGKTALIGPAADIHSLGAILYELLTGRPPYLGATALETLHQVVDQDPLPPSRLQSKTPRDLETICLKCLEKDLSKRYPSANALADDLRRFLANEPILASPVSFWRRGWKMARRRPALASLLAVVLMAAIALVGGGLWHSTRLARERDRAEESLELAMSAVDEMLSEVGEQQLSHEPRMEEKRRALLGKALTLHQKFLQHNSDNPRVREQTAFAYRRIADVYRLLQRHNDALGAYQSAIELLEPLHAASKDDPGLRQQLAYCRNFQGEVLRAAGHRQEAHEAYQQAMRIDEALAKDFPANTAYRQDLARARYNLGILQRETNQLDDAERQLQQSVALLNELVEQTPDSPAHRQHLARALLNLGTVIRAPQRVAEAQKSYDRAADLLLPLIAQFPQEPDYRHELGVVYLNLGNLHATAGRLEPARAMYGNSRDHFQALAADFPRTPVYRQELANAFNSIGNAYAREQKHAESIQAWGQAAVLLRQLIVERANVPTYHGDLGMVLGNLGLAHHAQSQLPKARTHLQQAVERLNESLKLHHEHAVYRQVLRDTYQNLAEILVLSMDHAAAAQAARDLCAVFPESARDHYIAACFLARCVEVAKNDTGLSLQRCQTLTQEYRDQSMNQLHQAVAKGFNDVQQMKKDQATIFNELASRPDYRELLKQLAKSTPSEAL